MPSSGFDVPKLVCVLPSLHPSISAEVIFLSYCVIFVLSLHPVLGRAFPSLPLLHFTLPSSLECFNRSPLLGVNDLFMSWFALYET